MNLNVKKAGALQPLPQKWRKYELLDLFGLTDIKYVRATIHRFRRDQPAAFLSQLRKAVTEASRNCEPGEYLFVTKFVPSRLAVLLPNVRVQSMNDLETVERALREMRAEYDEIWFCYTSLSKGCLSVGGRLMVDYSGKYSHTVEQVWRCSPRLIESFGPDFPYPLVRATRSGWGWSMRITALHLPVEAPETPAVIRTQFSTALRKLDQIRERLERFTDAIGLLGLNVSVEYKIEGEKLQIIDWDTGNDLLVLAKLLQCEGHR